MNDTSGTKRMTQRPAHLDAPAHLSKSPPVPTPQAMSKEDADRLAEGPTRYGDWERKGMAIDF